MPGQFSLLMSDDCSGIMAVQPTREGSELRCDALGLLGNLADPEAAIPDPVTVADAGRFYCCLNTCLETYRKQ